MPFAASGGPRRWRRRDCTARNGRTAHLLSQTLIDDLHGTRLGAWDSFPGIWFRALVWLLRWLRIISIVFPVSLSPMSAWTCSNASNMAALLAQAMEFRDDPLDVGQRGGVLVLRLLAWGYFVLDFSG